MFLTNKYRTWYFSIIDSAVQRDSTRGEKHHVIPKSLGGSNEKVNIVRLTSREHFICHKLLFKMTTGEDRRKMATALVLMGGRKTPSKTYSEARAVHAAHISSVKKGSTHTDAAKTKMSAARMGKPCPWNKGRVKSDAELETLRTMDRSYMKDPSYGAKISAKNIGKKFWNNGQRCIRAIECPGPEWVSGRLKR